MTQKNMAQFPSLYKVLVRSLKKMGKSPFNWYIRNGEVRKKEALMLSSFDNWPTQQVDLADAQTIIDKHIDLNDGEPLVLELDLERGLLVVPDWIDEVKSHFISKYGRNRGDEVFSRILTYCVVGDEQVH